MKVLIKRKPKDKKHIKKCKHCRSVFIYKESEKVASDKVICPVCKKDNVLFFI